MKKPEGYDAEWKLRKMEDTEQLDKISKLKNKIDSNIDFKEFEQYFHAYNLLMLGLNVKDLKSD